MAHMGGVRLIVLPKQPLLSPPSCRLVLSHGEYTARTAATLALRRRGWSLRPCSWGRWGGDGGGSVDAVWALRQWMIIGPCVGGDYAQHGGNRCMRGNEMSADEANAGGPDNRHGHGRVGCMCSVDTKRGGSVQQTPLPPASLTPPETVILPSTAQAGYLARRTPLPPVTAPPPLLCRRSTLPRNGGCPCGAVPPSAASRS